MAHIKNKYGITDMFRKIVSSLAFSPALVGQLGYYAKRMRKEESRRRIGLIFIALAVIVQGFAVFYPPEITNTANEDNIIYSGIQDTEDLLSLYDRGIDSAGNTDIKQIYTQFGISRSDIMDTYVGNYTTDDFNGTLQTVGRSDWGVAYRSPIKVSGTDTTVYRGYNKDAYTTPITIPALIGTRSLDNAWFAIPLDYGTIVYATPPVELATSQVSCSALRVTSIVNNDVTLTTTTIKPSDVVITGYEYRIANSADQTVFSQQVPSSQAQSDVLYTLPSEGDYTAQVTITTEKNTGAVANCSVAFSTSDTAIRCALNEAILQTNPDCRPCDNAVTVWYKDTACAARFELTKKVRNLTQSLDDAQKTTVQPGDQLHFTLSVKNSGNTAGDYVIEDSLTDILEYATIITIGDGTIIAKNSVSPTVVRWPSFTINAGETMEKVVVVRVNDTIPATAAHLSNTGSYNCTLTNTFGETLNVRVACPPEKIIEQAIGELPTTGKMTNIFYSALVVVIASYFYVRARQLSAEVRIIRRDLHDGII